MSWFWGGKNDTRKDDPTKSLQPDLKQFLNEQQPRPYIPSGAPRSESEKLKKEPLPLPDTNKRFEGRPLPKESLFQDGRYEHIWKTYTPQDDITAATTSTVERIITAKRDRRSLIYRAAMENCAFEDEIRMTCFDRGTLADQARARMTMCAKESKAFNRCFQLQSKFLTALGYLTSANTSSEDEEKIQMHADKLYHRMMDYEAAVEEAKENGDPIPPLTSVFNPTKPAPTIEELNLPPQMERAMEKPLHDLPPHERELAVRAVLQHAKITHLYADEFKRYAIDMNEGRKSRQDWLIRVFGEPIGKFIIPDPPRAPDVKPYSVEDLERRIWENESARPVEIPTANTEDGKRNNAS